MFPLAVGILNLPLLAIWLPVAGQGAYSKMFCQRAKSHQNDCRLGGVMDGLQPATPKHIDILMHFDVEPSIFRPYGACG